MKNVYKLLLMASLVASSLNAATDEQIVKYFKSQIPVPTVTVKVTSRIPIQQIEGMDYVSLNLSDGSRTQKLSVFTQGDLIFPDVITIKEGSIKDKLDKQKLAMELAKLYKNQNKDKIITLGNDPEKETLVKFTDPECPFCRKEVENIEEKLKKYNLKYIFTPVHDKSSLEKAILIEKQTKDAKSTEEKIKIIKKYFSETASVDEKVSDEEVQAEEAQRRAYFDAGLKGVPFYVNEKELLK
ncbi:thioredoxin domain-containing protein [Sulfurospirillum sp. 1307]|jgi:thiol:disulfide interchange protein DsbC